MEARAFLTQKEAESESDCQDRFSINYETESVAVSDGMSQSLFPKYWAEILVRKYTSERDWIPSKEQVRALAPLWREKVDERLEEMRRSGQDTWRAQNMLDYGHSAGATLAGIRIEDTHWHCDVLGDSCLVVVNGSKIEEIYSSMDTTAFGNYPDYFDSDPTKMGKGDVLSFEGKWTDNLTLLLVSDPLAEYLSTVRGTSLEEVCIREILCVESAEEFAILVEYFRKDGMHNDDTTLCIIKNGRS